MKIGRNQILALSLTLLLTLPVIAASLSTTSATAETNNTDESWPVEPEPYRNGTWYKFETPLVTLLFPAGGRKPMFIWWYTNDSSEIYVVKFKGIIEYLAFDLPYYDRRYPADNLTIQEMIRQKYIEPKIGHLQQTWREQIRKAIMGWLIFYLADLHLPYLPFSACSWRLDGPTLVVRDDVSYWSFNFTLKDVPMPRFSFAEGNIQIRCRFYNSTTTEIIDENHNYTVAAGQLKFDFVVSHWEWNIDKLKNFVNWLNASPYAQYNIEIPEYKTGLALWINMASINLEDIIAAENEFQNQYQETVEAQSRMQGVTINGEYYPVIVNRTANEYERQIQLTNRFRERTRICFARKEGTIAGFLEFVPWARLLDDSGSTVDYVNVTASYIAAGGHLRLFLCYPYFNSSYTLEHDPTIGVDTAPSIPMLVTPEMLEILLGATIAIGVAVAAVKLRKKVINIANLQ